MLETESLFLINAPTLNLFKFAKPLFAFLFPFFGNSGSRVGIVAIATGGEGSDCSSTLVATISTGLCETPDSPPPPMSRTVVRILVSSEGAPSSVPEGVGIPDISVTVREGDGKGSNSGAVLTGVDSINRSGTLLDVLGKETCPAFGSAVVDGDFRGFKTGKEVDFGVIRSSEGGVGGNGRAESLASDVSRLIGDFDFPVRLVDVTRPMFSVSISFVKVDKESSTP